VSCALVVVHLQAHAVVYLVVFQCDVILVHVVPLLDADLLGPGADLRRDELLEVTDGVVLAVCEGGGDGGELGTVRFGRSGRLGFPQGAHRGEKGGAGGHEGVGCVDTHLHLTRIFLPRRSLSTTSIMRAVAYPSGCVEGVAPRMAVSTFRHHFPRNFDGADRQTKFSTVRFGHFERARPSCGPEAPCCSSRCSSGAS
jgi:hypothetical protein